MIPNPQAKRILCYGDSNTWGQNPHIKGGRFSIDERWTGVVQQALGDRYALIEEGLSSRTTDLEYKHKPGRNGRAYFRPCLESQNPLDLVILMLGTNDLKIEFGPRSTASIAAAMKGYIEDVRAYAKDIAGSASRAVLMSPIYVNTEAPRFSEWYADKYDDRAVKLSHTLAADLQEIAKNTGCFFFDAASVALPGEDGIHISADGHKALGEKMAAKIMDWLQ